MRPPNKPKDIPIFATNQIFLKAPWTSLLYIRFECECAPKYSNFLFKDSKMYLNVLSKILFYRALGLLF